MFVVVAGGASHYLMVSRIGAHVGKQRERDIRSTKLVE
jgi:hypothetical protein